MITKVMVMVIYLVQLLFFSVQVFGQEGIASKYVRDNEIGSDPYVIFTENFEEGSLANVISRYSDTSNTAGMSLVNEIPSVSSGTRSILMTSIGGTNTGGHLFKRFSGINSQLYLRFYVKYAAGGTYHHCGGRLGGYNPRTNYPQGGAGIQPTGSNSFSAAAEPVESSLRFDFYTYWMHMRTWQNPITDPNTAYYGNDLINDASLITPVDKWMCVEIMVKLNDPVDSYNGELAMWIDGKEIAHLMQGSPNGTWVGDSFLPSLSGTPFEGFQWRNTYDLDINWLWLLHYVTDDPLGHVGRMWFDDVVVAKSYIGPINTSSSPLQYDAVNLSEQWRYFKGTTQPTSSWKQLSFDDSSWLSGAPAIGYGFNNMTTILSDMQNNYFTVYARKKFNITDLGNIKEMKLSIDYDDGFIAYLNGVEVLRASMPAGTVSSTTPAENHNGGSIESFDLTPHLNRLVQGENVLAFEIHNRSLSSSDLYFAPRLEVITGQSNISPDVTPPVKPKGLRLK